MTIREQRAAEIFIESLQAGGVEPDDQFKHQVAMAFFHYELFAKEGVESWDNAIRVRRHWLQALQTASGVVSKAIDDEAPFVRADADENKAIAEMGERIRRMEIAREVLAELAEEHGQIAHGLSMRVSSLKGRTNDSPQIRGRNMLMQRLFELYCKAAKIHPSSVRFGMGKSNPDRHFITALQSSFGFFFDLEDEKPEISQISKILKT